MKKVLSIIAAVLIVVIIALFVLVKIYVTPDRVKAFLIPAAETALNRKVAIGEISISLFTGIEVSDFSIKEADGTTDFLASKEFVLKYKLLPLLAKKVIIDELRIMSPEIRVVRDSEGRFNFETIGEKKKEAVQQEKTETNGAEGLPVSLLVSRLVIDNAGFYIKDHKKELPEIKGTAGIDTGIKGAGDGGLLSEGTFTLKLDKVVLPDNEKKHIENISAMLAYSVIVNLEADSITVKKADLTVQDVSASVTGEVKGLRTAPELNIALVLPGTDTKSILTLAGLVADIKDISVSGNISSDLKIKGAPETLEAEGLVTLAKVSAVYKDMPAALDGNVHFKYKPDRVILDKSDMTVQGIPFSVKGEVTDLKKAPAINLDITVAQSKAANILEAVKPFVDTKDMSLSGEVKADLNLRGRPSEIKTVKADGNIDLINLGMVYKGLPASINGSLAFKSNNVSINRTSMKIDEVPVSVSGSVTNIMDSPSLDISLSVPNTKAAALQKLAGSFTDLKGISLSGSLGADVTLKGRPDKIDTLKAKGDVRLQKVGVAYNEINAMLDGGLRINEESMSIDMNTTYGKNIMQIKGTVDSYMKNQDIRLNVYSKKLYIDELEPILRITDKPSSEKSSEPGQQTPAPAKEAEPVNLTLKASGEVKVDAAEYKGMAIDDFLMKYNFKDNRLNLTETGKAGKGTFSLQTLLDLSKKGYTYTMSGNVNSLYIEEIINAFFPKAKDTIFGILTTNFKLNGAGTLPDNMKRNLIADGDFNIKNGKISNTELGRELSLLLNIRELETIEFTKSQGTLNVKNGTVRLDSIFQSDKLAMDPKGNLGLIDETVDMAFDLKLSPRLTDKAMSSNISQYIRDKEGWGTVPLLVTGTFAKPKYTVDVAKVGQKVIEKEVNKLLEKLINKDDDKKQRQPQQQQQTPQQKQDQTQQPANPVEDLLKQLPGLFEKK